jgi:hypothetical protein
MEINNSVEAVNPAEIISPVVNPAPVPQDTKIREVRPDPPEPADADILEEGLGTVLDILA